MKIAILPSCRRAVCAALALAFLSHARADNGPRIDVLRVAKIATDYLATHGQNAPYVTSIALESDAILNGKSSWVVRFSRPLLADGNKEIGMRVKFDGSVSYLIEDKSAPKKRSFLLKS